MATLVKFRKDINTDEIVAVFPQLIYNKLIYGKAMKTCYANLGQHSSCSVGWMERETTPATPEEYASLKAELESIGYTLKVCK